jgi:hypothetical protein
MTHGTETWVIRHGTQTVCKGCVVTWDDAIAPATSAHPHMALRFASRRDAAQYLVTEFGVRPSEYEFECERVLGAVELYEPRRRAA